MIKLSIKPEDVLADGQDCTMINGQVVRKGSVAAFLANLDILEDPISTQAQKETSLQTMRELAKALVAIGLHKHVIFKNKQVEQILVEAEL